LVLPCPPNENEKASYIITGRRFLMTWGVIAMCSVSAGMWLYVLSSEYLYWFGAPAAFLTLYLFLSYYGIAVWGKECNLREHRETVVKAEDEGCFPSVDVFLPCCGEPLSLMANTYKYVQALDWPNLKVHVLDDGANEEIRYLADLHGFNYIRRDNRPAMRKAGNLRWAFAHTSGDLFVVFDADFCPRSDFLRETVPYFREEKVAIVQTPQFFRYRSEQSWVERGAGVTQELFYRVIQVRVLEGG
ncbi:unnamed protein product, partial [Choristocarpus tenellus]